MSKATVTRIRSRMTRLEMDGVRVIRDGIRAVYPLAGSLRVLGMSFSVPRAFVVLSVDDNIRLEMEFRMVRQS